MLIERLPSAGKMYWTILDLVSMRLLDKTVHFYYPLEVQVI
jgi:hypothetical protein